LTPEVARQSLEGIRRAALEKHPGMVAPFPAEMFNVTPERRDWVNRRCVPQALATFEIPILLSGRVDAIERRILSLPMIGIRVPFVSSQRNMKASPDGKS